LESRGKFWDRKITGILQECCVSYPPFLTWLLGSTEFRVTCYLRLLVANRQDQKFSTYTSPIVLTMVITVKCLGIMRMASELITYSCGHLKQPVELKTQTLRFTNIQLANFIFNVIRTVNIRRAVKSITVLSFKLQGILSKK